MRHLRYTCWLVTSDMAMAGIVAKSSSFPIGETCYRSHIVLCVLLRMVPCGLCEDVTCCLDAAGCKHTREEGSVVPVDLHTVFRRWRHLGGRAHAAPHARLRDLTLQVEPDRAGFVNAPGWLRLRLGLLCDCPRVVGNDFCTISLVFEMSAAAAADLACMSSPMLARYAMAGIFL